jgi:hypothetical protein
VSRKTTPLYEVFPGSDFSGLAYRIVQRCPPTLHDFLSYEALGMPYDRRDFFKGTGISVFRTAERARSIARHFDHGRAIAAIDLALDGIVWCPTGRRGHVTVWAPAELLLERVIQCENHDQ